MCVGDTCRYAELCCQELDYASMPILDCTGVGEEVEDGMVVHGA